MNTSQLIYMAGTGAAHLFKVNSVLCAQIDSNGVTVNTTAGTSNALNVTIAATTTSLTANEVTYLSGVTSAIQTQLNNKQASGLCMILSGAQTLTGSITAAVDTYLFLSAKPSEHAYLSGVSSNIQT